MEHRPIDTRPVRAHAIRADLVGSLLLAALLSIAWAVMDWPQVGRLNLPDTDDMMRLAQIRDWIAGQGFNDWTQYRVAPPAGAPMHWSRINDALPALIIVLLDPLVGRTGAELTAVLVYPALLFAAYLFLAARIARVLGPAAGAPVAIIVAALAYPANALFLPGRIDHHGLQVVVMLAGILSLMRPGSAARGAILGGAIGVSFGIGLETAPHALALMAVLFALWLVRGAAEQARMRAAGGALIAVTLILVAFARPTYWSTAWCDAFTPASVTAALVGGTFWLLVAAVPARAGWRLRLAIGGGLGAAGGAIILAAFPGCLSGPYGAMDPLVERLLIGNISEAQGLFDQWSPVAAIQACGLLFATSAVAAWLARCLPAQRPALLPLGAILLICDLLVLAQLRGAYLGVALAGPIMAQAILAARARTRGRTPALVAAWLGSAGMVWVLVPDQLQRIARPRVHAIQVAHKSCRQDDVWQQLDRFAPGVVMTSPDHAARLIGATRHSSVGAGYHRSDTGNRAMYEFFLSPPERAIPLARAWRVRYVLFCPGDFVGLAGEPGYAASIAARLAQDQPPPWLQQQPLQGTGMRFYRTR